MIREMNKELPTSLTKDKSLVQRIIKSGCNILLYTYDLGEFKNEDYKLGE